MSADFNDIVKQSYVKFKSKHVGSWNKRWLVLKRASSKGPARVEKYASEEASFAPQPGLDKAILLADSTEGRLSNSVKKHAIEMLLSRGGSKMFCLDSEHEANEWMKAFTKAREFDSPGVTDQVAPPDLIPPPEVLPSTQFYVFLCPTPLINGKFGECILTVDRDCIRLGEVEDSTKVFASWPLVSIREFGNDESKFSFQSGRRCVTGEGLFTLNTLEGDIIRKKVHSASVMIQCDKGAKNRPPLLRSGSEPAMKHCMASEQEMKQGALSRKLPPVPTDPGTCGASPVPPSCGNTDQYVAVDSERYPPLRVAQKDFSSGRREVPAPPALPARARDRPLPQPPSRQVRNQSYETVSVGSSGATNMNAQQNAQNELSAQYRRMIQDRKDVEDDDEVL